MKNLEMNQGLFEDGSTIHFGGEDGEQFDFLAGFDDEGTSAGTAEADTTAEAEDTGDGFSDPETEEAGTDDGVAPTTEQDAAEVPADPEKYTFIAKIDHKDQEVTVAKEDLPTMYQKAQNMDRANQRANTARQEADQYKKNLDRIAATARTLNFQGETPEEVIQAMLDSVTESARNAKVSSMVNAGTAKDVAEFIVDQQMKPQEPVEVPASVSEGTQSDVPTPEQFNQDLQMLLARRPELRQQTHFPDEVLQAYAQGEDLTVAYLDYESRKSAAEKAELENQNRIFKQNQESANKAPVRGVSGSGTTGAKEDPWLAGFDDESW